MRLDKWIKSLITDTSKSLKERVFIVLTMAATAVCGIAFIGDVVYSDSIVEIIMLIGTLIIVPIVTMLGVKTNRVDLATRVICLGMILLKKCLHARLVTVSIAGGLLHNLGQLLVAVFVLDTPSLFYYLVVLWISGAIAGTIIGLICVPVVSRVNHRD